MSEKADNNSSDWNLKLIIGLIVGGVLFGIFWFIHLRFIFSKKIGKGKLAKEYGVENKILMKWLKHFGNEEGITLYHGKLIRNVKRTYFTAFLGEPGSGPKYKDKPLVKKEDIWIAVDSNETSVREKIKALKNPEEVIGMTYETYKSMDYLPPRYMSKIVKFLKTGEPLQQDLQDILSKKRS